MAWDVLIRGATVFDGTGSPPRALDLGVQGDRIVFMGQATTQGALIDLDARGLVVSPGFIDIHTHCSPPRPPGDRFGVVERALIPVGITKGG